MKEKLKEIYNEYMSDLKEVIYKLKKKFKKLKSNVNKILVKLKSDLKNKEIQKKYAMLLILLVFINLLIINLFTAFGYYNDIISIPLVEAKVGNIYSNNYDYILHIYAENDNNLNTTSKYRLINNIPYMGYVYSGYKCNNKSTLIYDENSKSAKVNLKGKDICSVYFDLVSEQDIKLYIMIEENVGTDTYKETNNIPIYGYKYSHYECNNNSTLEYDSNLHKVKITASSKDSCQVYFTKEASDLGINLFIENTFNSNDYYQSNKIPENISYSLDEEKSVCKNRQNERSTSQIEYIDGYLNINTNEMLDCDVYLKRND